MHQGLNPLPFDSHRDTVPLSHVTSLPNVSQFQSLQKIRRPTNFIELRNVDPRILRPWNSECAGWVPNSRLFKIQILLTLQRDAVKRLHQKELPSRPVGLNFHGLDALSLSQLKIEGTSADKMRGEKKYKQISLLLCGYKH